MLERKTAHEEADINIISHVNILISLDKKNSQVVADDADIFLLLVHYCWKWNATGVTVSMKKSDGSVIDIDASTSRLREQCSDIRAMHALTGCDTTRYPFGKGKLSALKVLPNTKESTLELEVVEDGRRFFALIYGSV